MTLDDLDSKTASLDVLRSAWEIKLQPIVAAKVQDAHAHALKALTDTLKKTRDGRSSILQINRSVSYAAALARLDELWRWLAGPSEVSLTGQIRDARAAFLTEAARHWHPLIPPDYRSRPEHEPTQNQVQQIRAAAIHGYDPRKSLEGQIGTAKRSLKAALEQAGRRSTPSHVEDDLLAAWATRTTSTISETVKTLLSDSMVYADREAGRGLIRPEAIAGHNS